MPGVGVTVTPIDADASTGLLNPGTVALALIVNEPDPGGRNCDAVYVNVELFDVAGTIAGVNVPKRSCGDVVP